MIFTLSIGSRQGFKTMNMSKFRNKFLMTKLGVGLLLFYKVESFNRLKMKSRLYRVGIEHGELGMIIFRWY